VISHSLFLEIFEKFKVEDMRLCDDKKFKKVRKERKPGGRQNGWI
jgi:hypothetical protein